MASDGRTVTAFGAIGLGGCDVQGATSISNLKIGGGATGTIRPSTSPRMPTSGFEVRGRIVRQRSQRFAGVRFEVDGRGQEFAVVRRRSPKFAGVAVTVAVKKRL